MNNLTGQNSNTATLLNDSEREAIASRWLYLRGFEPQESGAATVRADALSNAGLMLALAGPAADFAGWLSANLKANGWGRRCPHIEAVRLRAAVGLSVMGDAAASKPFDVPAIRRAIAAERAGSTAPARPGRRAASARAGAFARAANAYPAGARPAPASATDCR